MIILGFPKTGKTYLHEKGLDEVATVDIQKDEYKDIESAMDVIQKNLGVVDFILMDFNMVTLKAANELNLSPVIVKPEDKYIDEYVELLDGEYDKEEVLTALEILNDYEGQYTVSYIDKSNYVTNVVEGIIES